MNKKLIIGYGIAGCYLAESLKDVCNITIIADDIAGAGVGGRTLQWGKILYFSEHSKHRSRQSEPIALPPIAMQSLLARFGLTLAKNTDVYWKNSNKWFSKADYKLRKSPNINFIQDELLYFNERHLFFESRVLDLDDFDRIYIYTNHISLLRILRRSCNLHSPIYYGNHFSRKTRKSAIATNFLHRFNLIIRRKEFCNPKGQLQYTHKIPEIYPKLLKDISNNNSILTIHRLMLIFYRVAMKKRFWQLVASVLCEVNLAKLSEVITINKIDTDVRPDDCELILDSCASLLRQRRTTGIPIDHEYGIDKRNYDEIIKMLPEKISLNPSIHLTQLGAANATLPILSLIEHEA